MARCSPGKGCAKLSSILTRIALLAVVIRSGSLSESVSNSSYNCFQSMLLGTCALALLSRLSADLLFYRALAREVTVYPAP